MFTNIIFMQEIKNKLFYIIIYKKGLDKFY